MGVYFQKINCFCFSAQTLKAGEEREMTVVFYIDPALAKDADGADLNTITLSYTFYPQRGAAAGGGEHSRHQGNRNATAARGDDERSMAARQAARLPPRRSEPLADRRRDLGLRDGGRRHRLDDKTFTFAPLVFGAGVIGVPTPC